MPDHSDSPEQQTGDAVADAFARWAAAERAAGAASERTRERWLRQQAADTATMSGVLVDLAERETAVVVRIGGPSGDLSGRLVGVGRDFLVLEEPAGATLIAVHAVDAVVAEPASPGVLGPSGDGRSPTLELSFAAAVTALAADRLPVRLRLAGGQTLAGELAGVGSDVVWLRGSPPRRGTVFVPLAAVMACSPR